MGIISWNLSTANPVKLWAPVLELACHPRARGQHREIRNTENRTIWEPRRIRRSSGYRDWSVPPPFVRWQIFFIRWYEELFVLSFQGQILQHFLRVVQKWLHGLKSLKRGSMILWQQNWSLSNKKCDDGGKGSKNVQNCVTFIYERPLRTNLLDFRNIDVFKNTHR